MHAYVILLCVFVSSIRALAHMVLLHYIFHHVILDFRLLRMKVMATAQ